MADTQFTGPDENGLYEIPVEIRMNLIVQNRQVEGRVVQSDEADVVLAVDPRKNLKVETNDGPLYLVHLDCPMVYFPPVKE